ncbi:MAG: aspartate kinase [Acidobacteria bacterium]|nr:aspartate kinase [Acidobacteriota bacterium]MEC7767653.1 aspartate kinase [Acidobacteriota bacterium]|tara:strand:- start:499 stop:1743 length:1245 start_codon:yes stop_codon:yes gene_type:complete
MSRADGLVVQKYGGTSISNPDKVIAVAERVKRRLATVKRLVVVVSAMGDSTDELVALAQKVSRQPRGREMDLLLASGEQVAVSTLSLALQDRGVDAISLTAAQCGIRTDGVFNLARIRSIDTRRIVGELDAGRVVIITGFQGITESDEITTLGRGGSDVTGAAVAAALGASVCEICTDVAGVLSADPRLVVGARKWSEISYEEAIELASSGAKVLHPRAAEICMSYEIPIHVRSSFTDESGTWIRSGGSIMEQAEVVGVTSDKEIAKITLLNVADRPGTAAQLFEELAEKQIGIRLIIQSASSESRARITFIVDEQFVDGAVEVVEKWKTSQLASDVLVERDVAKISIIGSRLASTPGLAARMFKVLAREGINIDCISSSEMKVACVIASRHLERAVKTVHNEFFHTQAQPVAG